MFGLSAASLMSLVIIFLSFCCLFFAESWIICVYALLLDDSCAVGLQSVFQIRWIMNKPMQQKSCVLYEPCLSSSAPVYLACQPQVSRKVSLMLKLSRIKSVNGRKRFHLISFNLPWIFPCANILITAFSPKLAVRNPASLSAYLTFELVKPVWNLLNSVWKQIPHYYDNIHNRSAHPQGNNHVCSLSLCVCLLPHKK